MKYCDSAHVSNTYYEMVSQEKKEKKKKYSPNL